MHFCAAHDVVALLLHIGYRPSSCLFCNKLTLQENNHYDLIMPSRTQVDWGHSSSKRTKPNFIQFHGKIALLSNSSCYFDCKVIKVRRAPDWWMILFLQRKRMENSTILNQNWPVMQAFGSLLQKRKSKKSAHLHKHYMISCKAIHISQESKVSTFVLRKSR